MNVDHEIAQSLCLENVCVHQITLRMLGDAAIKLTRGINTLRTMAFTFPLFVTDFKMYLL